MCSRMKQSFISSQGLGVRNESKKPPHPHIDPIPTMIAERRIADQLSKPESLGDGRCMWRQLAAGIFSSIFVTGVVPKTLIAGTCLSLERRCSKTEAQRARCRESTKQRTMPIWPARRQLQQLTRAAGKKKRSRKIISSHRHDGQLVQGHTSLLVNCFWLRSSIVSAASG
jgi:hypothetical protein